MVQDPGIGPNPSGHIAELIQVPVVDVHANLPVLIAKACLEALGETLYLFWPRP